MKKFGKGMSLCSSWLSKKTSKYFWVLIVSSLTIFLAFVVFLTVSKHNISSGVSLHDDPRRPYLTNESDYYVPDSFAGHFHKTHAKRTIKWGEHRNGKITMKTNNLGFRNDAETKPEKPPGTIRVIVTGDSHVDGVVNNDESVAAHLSRLLGAQGDGKTNYEVLCGGVGYYTFQNYKGLLNRFLYLNPDLFIVIMYAGNDFMDAIRFAEVEKELSVPERSKDYLDRLNRALNMEFRARGPIIQAYNQIAFFTHYPDMKDRSLRIAERELLEMQEICSRNNISFMVAILPTKLDVEPQSDTSFLGKINDTLELSEKDLSVNRLLSGYLTEFLTKRGIICIDPLEFMKTNGLKFGELYWRQDYHLNDKGHQVVADALYRQLRFPLPGKHR